MSGLTVKLYVKRSGAGYKEVTNFFKKNFTMISSKMFVKIYCASPKNEATIRKMGITRYPTLVVQNKKIIGTGAIINFWRTYDTPKPNISGDEMIRRYQMEIAKSTEDNDIEELNMRKVGARMERMRANKPHIRDVKIPAKKQISVGDTDDEFLDAVGVDNVFSESEENDLDNKMEEFMRNESRKNASYSQFNF